MIRKSVQRFSLATNAKRLCGDHAQSKALWISLIARLKKKARRISPPGFSRVLMPID
jgi:hypothetical protein